MNKITILILLVCLMNSACSSRAKKSTPESNDDAPIEKAKGPSPKVFTVNEEDTIALDFDRIVHPGDSTMVPPTASIKIKRASGEEGDLLVVLSIADTSSSDISKVFAKLRAENNTQDISTTFTFSDTDLTYADLLKKTERHKLKSEGPLMEKVNAKVRLSVGGISILGRNFVGGITPLEFGNFPVYVFDCHSVWSLFDFKTFCRVFNDCIECMTYVWFDGEWKNQQRGFHHCYCLD